MNEDYLPSVNRIDPNGPGSRRRSYALPSINLWDKPRARRGSDRIVGVIPRGTPVEVLEERSDGWKRVRTRPPAPPIEGWVHKTFLLDPS